PLPIRRIPYDEAIGKYGSDRPDLRFGLELVDVTPVVKDAGFKVFADVAARGGLIKAINAKGAADWPRRELDHMIELAQEWGAGGLAWIAIQEDGYRSAITKFFTEDELLAIRKELDAEP